MTTPSNLRRTAVVRRFLERYFADEERGETLSLEEYQDAFPAHATAVAEAWQVLTDAEVDGTEVPKAASLAALAQAANGTGLGTGDMVGPYRLGRVLGEGGQGVVHLATDTRLSREVAIKLLTRVHLKPNDARILRFRREAELAARLDHPGLCAVYEADLEGGVPYIVMPHVEGPTLATLLDESSPLEVDYALALVEKVARALHAAHIADVIHRDIKPTNIVVTGRDTGLDIGLDIGRDSESGQPVLMDFGIAHDLGDEGPALTLTGEMLGTVPYMAPEQVRGEPVGSHTDVYALGATLYEAVTGKLPHDEPTQRAQLNAIARDAPADPRQFNDAVGRDLAVVLGVALEKDPARRFRSAEQFAEELRRIRSSQPILSRPASLSLRLMRSFQRDPRLASSILAAFALLIGGLVIALLLLDRVDGERRSKERALSEIELLADMTRLEQLWDDMEPLRPAEPGRIPDIEAWLERSDELIARLPLHRRVLSEIRARGTAPANEQPWTFDSTADDWRHRLQEELVDGLISLQGDDVFGKTHANVTKLYEFAATIQKRSIENHLGAWKAATDRVAADPRFDGFELRQQMGLVPLGPDPESGLEEFADLATGEPPQRDSETQRLAPGEDSGVVLVLLPGGEEVQGAVKPSAEHPLGSPNIDPQARADEGPLATVQLDPFLISKYEMTQGQWLRVTGTQPSYYRVGEQYEKAGTVTLAHPVDSVSWNMVDDALGLVGLTLPTSAQWEHAARAGTTTPWAWGSETECLFGRCNMADLSLQARTGSPGRGDGYKHDDNWAGPAPVGSYQPNAFGMHDTAGNLQEWVRDIDHDREALPRPGDGLRTEGDEHERLVRGGGYLLLGHEARSAARHRFAPETVNLSVGVRPSRRMTLSD